MLRRQRADAPVYVAPVADRTPFRRRGAIQRMAVVPRTQEPSQKQRKRSRARRRGWLFWESLFRPEATTFRRLCRMEPRLYALYEEACAVEYDPDAAVFCATIVFYDHFKPRMDALFAGH